MAKTKVTSGVKANTGVRKRRILRVRESMARPPEQDATPSKKARRQRSVSPQSGHSSDEESELPPELRPAGLLAQAKITKGKIFGPFHGCISTRKKPPQDHILITKMKNEAGKTHYFFVEKKDKSKCSWLKCVSSATSKDSQNIVAYSSTLGVSYEAIKDIEKGEELFVYYKEDEKKSYPAYVESSLVEKPKSKRKSSKPTKVVSIEEEEEELMEQSESEDNVESNSADPDYDGGSEETLSSNNRLVHEEQAKEQPKRKRGRKKLRDKDNLPIEIIEIEEVDDEEGIEAGGKDGQEIVDKEGENAEASTANEQSEGVENVSEIEGKDQGNAGAVVEEGTEKDPSESTIEEQDSEIQKDVPTASDSAQEKTDTALDSTGNVSTDSVSGGKDTLGQEAEATQQGEDATGESSETLKPDAAQETAVEDESSTTAETPAQPKKKGVKLQCSRCKIMFTSREAAGRHRVLNSCRHCDFHCERCNKGFRTYVGLRVHKCKDDSTACTFRCSKCKTDFTDSKEFSKHKREVHPPEKSSLPQSSLSSAWIITNQLHHNKSSTLKAISNVEEKCDGISTKLSKELQELQKTVSGNYKQQASEIQDIRNDVQQIHSDIRIMGQKIDQVMALLLNSVNSRSDPVEAKPVPQQHSEADNSSLGLNFEENKEEIAPLLPETPNQHKSSLTTILPLPVVPIQQTPVSYSQSRIPCRTMQSSPVLTTPQQPNPTHYVNLPPRIQGIIDTSTHRHLLALKLVDAMFTKAEVSISNVNGCRGKPPLDPSKMGLIKALVFGRFPLTTEESASTSLEKVWSGLTMKIDSKCRNVRLKLCK